MYCNSLEGVVFANDAETAGATGTSEQTLMSFSLPANSLYKNGQALRITAFLKHAANTNAIDPKLYFGGSSITLADCATSGGIEKLSLLVIRRGSASQLVLAEAVDSGGASVTSPALTAGTDDLTAAVTIKLTVTGDNSGADMSAESLRVEFLQNP